MAVVINEFEVMPRSPAADQPSSDGNQSAQKSSAKPELSDHEVKQMIERRLERLERVSAH